MSLDKLTVPVEEPDDNVKGNRNTFDYMLFERVSVHPDYCEFP